LSYTTFAYSDLQLNQEQISDTDTLTVKLKVKNTGNVAGKEIIQLYVRDVQSTVFRPEKELKGFEKVDLQPDEETEVIFELNSRAFAYYEPRRNDWHVEAGTFEIMVGASSADIRLKAAVQVHSASKMPSIDDHKKLATYYNFPKGTPVSQVDFESLLGRLVPPNLGQTKGSYDINTPLGDMNDSFIARKLYSFLKRQMRQMIQDQEDTPTALMMEATLREIPLRAMLMMGGDTLNREMLDALLIMINGKFFRGVGALIKAMGKK
jgi:beta-glucosidase